MAFDQIEELVGKIDSHNGRLVVETEHSLAAPASIAETGTTLSERLDRHLAALDDRKSEFEELVAAVAEQAAALAEQAAALRALELCLPDHRCAGKSKPTCNKPSRYGSSRARNC